ncbi:MAG TPA: PAS domain S-box protein [Paucimonas sp.]|nr:PAS domain S-box protein [Paucimonas sp.]
MQVPRPRLISSSSFRTRKYTWRWFVPLLLMLLFLPIVLWLPWQAQKMESTERQEQLIADTLWVEQAIRFQLGRDEESVGLIAADLAAGTLSPEKFRERANTLRRNNRELVRLAWLDAEGKSIASSDEAPLDATSLSHPSRLAAQEARATRRPQYSPPAAAPGRRAPMLLDYHVPLLAGERYTGSLIASYSTTAILEEMVPWWFAQDNEIALLDGEDNVIDRRAAGGLGRGVYTHSRPLDLPGLMLTLRTNSLKSAPKLLPNLLVGSVILLSVGLLWSLWALWRDITRRIAAEGALRQQVAFRTAMENSLLTGLRARDLEGRITYVNPAFCQMVGLPAEELIGKAPPMPYWAPEAMDEYQQRFSQVLQGTVTPQFETIFQRAGGERFPVLIYESPLVDDSGRQTGWMGSILDISDRKRAEELNRQQQEKLQAGARLATMGEIASTLAHELNQPLAAISSYAAGALNLLDSEAGRAGKLDMALLKTALEKAGAQAQRAGQIIRSVHAFVKKREPARETVRIAALIDSVLPLVELQAQRFFVVVQTAIAPDLPAVSADRVLLEQVLLNLTRNAIEAMRDAPSEKRVLRIAAGLGRDAADDKSAPNVVISVIDQGHGIAPDVAERLFSPFFSTKAEGMGMGLNICRTAAEFHGGTLVHEPNPLGGTIFRFTLPSLPEPSEEAACSISSTTKK